MPGVTSGASLSHEVINTMVCAGLPHWFTTESLVTMPREPEDQAGLAFDQARHARDFFSSPLWATNADYNAQSLGRLIRPLAAPTTHHLA